MGYAKKVNWTVLGDYPAQIEALKPGEILRLEGRVEHINSVRGHLYNWMHSFAIKQLYRITQPTPEVMQVTRISKPNLRSSIEGRDTELLEFVAKQLIDFTNEDDALAVVRKELPQEKWIEAIEEWRRMIG